MGHRTCQELRPRRRGEGWNGHLSEKTSPCGQSHLLTTVAEQRNTKSFKKEDVVGKPVIETSGKMKGKVKDLMFELGGTITLIAEGTDGKEFQVPLSRVTGISDDVVVRSEAEVMPSSSGSGTACKFCGKPLSPGQTWCLSCGRSQS